MIYTYMFPEPSIASQEKGIYTLQFCGRAIGRSRVVVKYVHIFHKPEENKMKEKKWNGSTIMFPR